MTVHVTDVGMDVSMAASLTYVVQPKPTTLILTRVSPPSGPTAVGVPISLLATANGGRTLEYQFLWNYSATAKLSATWTKETYGNGRGYIHKPTQPGYYTFRVYAREKGSTANFQLASADVKVEVKPAVSAYDITFAPSGTGPVGGPITVSATNVVGGAQPQWKFWARKGGTSEWKLLQDYSPSPTCTTWKPETAGTYVVMVYCQEVGSKTANYDMSKTVTYTVK